MLKKKEIEKLGESRKNINKKQNEKNNYIIAEFDIKEDNQNIRIINSYEQNFKGKNWEIKKEWENEK